MEMVQCGQFNPTMRGEKKRRKISLEEYLDFIDSRNQLHLTVNHLHQIMSIHGFRKAQAQKKVLIEAVNSIDLIHPSRSTIQNDDVSSCAFIPMEVVIKDLVDLNWQECTITSLQTLNFMNYNFSLQNSNASTSKRKPKRSRKDLPRLEGVVDADTAIVALAAAKPSGEIGGTRSACSVTVDYQCDNRKRKMKSTNT